MKAHHLFLLGGLTLLLVAAAGQTADDDWGTVKGRVVWADDKIPERQEVKVNSDHAACLKNGPILQETFVIDPKTRGVRWVMVWLTHPDTKSGKDYKKEIPIHPSLKEIKDKKIVLDQPCCMFEPHVIGIREGQTLVCKNSAEILHNVKIDGGGNNPNLNPLLPAGKEIEVENWKPTGLGAVPFSCSIHGWMHGFARVFNHPYFAVTNEKGEFEIKNAPPGKFRLVVWHEEGFVQGGAAGIPITISAKGVTDLGKIDFKKPNN
jgi:hypothetical protein